MSHGIYITHTYIIIHTHIYIRVAAFTLSHT